MTRSRKLLLSMAILGGAGTAAGFGTFAAFSSTTSNAGNTFTAGSVTIADNDAGGSLYNATGQAPNDAVESCIQVTYGGTLASDVSIYTPSAIGAIGPYVDLKIESGTQASPTFPDCTGFSAETTHFAGTLASFAATHNDFASGITDYPGATAAWNSADTVVYRITATLADNTLAQGLTSGAHEFVWEAQNQ